MNEFVFVSTAPYVEFTKPLQDVEVREKESARFECEVSRESAKVRCSIYSRPVKKSLFFKKLHFGHI